MCAPQDVERPRGKGQNDTMKHDETFCREAGEPAGDLVPHGCCITTSPRQDGIALLGVVLQKIRQIVHHIVDLWGHFSGIETKEKNEP